MRLASYFIAGLLFAVGLTLGGMTQPHKIVAFLDVTRDWDPSLAFVMMGAISFHALSYRLIIRRKEPIYGGRFLIPRRSDIDPRLVVGAGLFGVGWGLGGFCPGPAIVASGTGVTDALIFVAALAGGHWLYGKFHNFSEQRRAKAEPEQSAQSALQGN